MPYTPSDRDGHHAYHAHVLPALFFLKRQSRTTEPVVLIDATRAGRGPDPLVALEAGTARLHQGRIGHMAVERLQDGAQETALRVADLDAVMLLLTHAGIPSRQRLQIADRLRLASGPDTVPVVWMWQQGGRLVNLGVYDVRRTETPGP